MMNDLRPCVPVVDCTTTNFTLAPQPQIVRGGDHTKRANMNISHS